MSIKSIAIETTDRAYLPEAYAYRDYFRYLGYYCQLVKKDSDDLLNYDCVVLFHGFHPFWKKYPKFVIGEYHSLSTGKFSRFKDILKRVVNVRPDLYIFLNESVREKLWFSKNINYITRGMGYSRRDFEEYISEEKIFDIVYCGSYRDGVLEEIAKMADLGLSIALVGIKAPFEHKNLTSFGRLDPNEAKKVISQSKYGFNYTPDVFPLNAQDSTKVIEYCAAGLGVITNKYKWVNDFERERRAMFLDLNAIKNCDDVSKFNFIIPDVSDLEWSIILKNTNINKYLV